MAPKCITAALLLLPPLPSWIWDFYVSRCIGRKALAVPLVVHVAGSQGASVVLPCADLPPKSNGSLRIVIISDTHEQHRLVTIPEADVLLHCGDILMASSLARQARGVRVMRDFNSWLEGLPVKEKVVIGGNHDRALERLGSDRGNVISCALVLQDSSATLRSGLKVYGHAYSEGHSHNQAWQEPLQVSEDACRDADIVMTHHSTSSIDAKVREYASPLLWASGHAHDKHGVYKR